MELLDAGGASSVSRKSEVLALAPAIPMKLVDPLDAGVAPLTSGTDWGVAAVGADTSPFSGDGIVAAVLDTGIDADHPAFKGVNLIRRNFTDDPADGDATGHGTHCAGTIFGRDVEGVRIGVARGVKKALIGKVLGRGGGRSDQIVRAIQWAVSEGANVISMSLGMDFPAYQKRLVEVKSLPPELATSRALEGYRLNVLLFERLAEFVSAQGAFMQAVLLIGAAGNDSQTDRNPEFKIAANPPAVCDGFLSVAAVGRSPDGLVRAPFSNSGALLAGPGVEITSARAGGGLVALNGTSMATPHVAGVAALWAQKLTAIGALNPKIWSSRLVGSATTAGLAPGFDPSDLGSGLVQAPQS